MRKRSWQTALAVIAVIATVMAFYVQFSEWRKRQEAGQRAEARLAEAMEESSRGAAAIVQGRTELPGDPPDDQPLPGTVLRRGESGGALQQVRDSQDEQAAALARLQESLDTLALQVERSDLALRRGLETLQVQVRREQEVSNKTLGLLLVALIPLVLHLLLSLRPPGGGEG